MIDFTDMLEVDKVEFCRRYGLPRWALDKVTAPVDAAQQEAERLSGVYGVNITKAQAAQILADKAVKP